MRLFLPGFSAALLALALAVVAHHLVTTDRNGLAIASLLAANVGSAGMGFIAVRAAKTEVRWWPRVLAGISLVGVTALFLQPVAASALPLTLRVLFALTSVVLFGVTILLLVLRPKESATFT